MTSIAPDTGDAGPVTDQSPPIPSVESPGNKAITLQESRHGY